MRFRPEATMNKQSRQRFRPSRVLSRRSNCGIDVVLLWSETTGGLTVRVSDHVDGSGFELHPPPELALEVFHHPYGYSERAEPAGVELPRAA
jgi:hypothetical protein